MRDLRRIGRSTILAAGCGLLAGCVGVAGPAPGQMTGPAPGGGAVPRIAGITPPPGAPYSGTCFAGIYACPLPASLPVGTACTCPGWGAPSYGVAR